MKTISPRAFPPDSHGSGTPHRILFRRLYPVVFIALFGSILYSDSIYNSFHFDDIYAIISNDSIRDIHKLGTFRSFDFHSRTRFIGFFTFALNYHFNGLDVIGYHLVNILIHIGASICAWWLALLLLSSPVMRTQNISSHRNLIAFGCGLVFVAHPIQTQAVTYIVQRFESLAAFFSLASLCFYMKARQTEKRPVTVLLFVISIAFAVLGMFTKETAFILPFIVMLLEAGFNRTAGLREPILKKRAATLLVPVILAAAIVSIMILAKIQIKSTFQPVVSDRFGDPPLTPWIYLLTQFRVIVKYIQLLFVPIHQNLDYDFPASGGFLEFQTLASFGILSGIFITAILLFPRRRLEALGILWFFLTLSVVSSFKPLKNVIFEHRLYLPMFGFGLFLASMLCHTVWRRNRTAAIVIFSCVIGFYSVSTYQRNGVWKDDFTLWSDVVKKSPNKARPHNNFGNALYRQGRYKEALAEYQTALRINPTFAESYNNIGNALSMLGRYEEAAGYFKKAIEYTYGDIEVYINYGNSLFLSGKVDEALEVFRSITVNHPDYINGFINLGETLYAKGQYDESAESFKKALSINPKDPEVHTKLGNALFKLGMVDEAVGEYTRALEINPDSAKTYYNLGIVYYSRGSYDEAIEYLRNALRIDPGYERARILLEQVLGESRALQRK